MKKKRYKYSKFFRALFTFAAFTYNEIVDKDDVVFIHLKRKRKTCICPDCGRRNKPTKESYKRTVRDLGMSSKDCYLTFFESKIRCRCGFRGYEKLDFVRPYSRCSVRFEKYAFKLCQKMALSDVSETLRINWKTAKDIDIHYTEEMLVSLKDIDPVRIGIDEIAYEKGHKYLTVVRDVDLGAVIWVGVGRKRETLDSFFDELGFEKTLNIEAAVMDMWDPYIASVNEHCPRVEIIFDKFHAVKIVNTALDDIRKNEFAKADDDQRKNMKKKRFLILRRQRDLNDQQRENLERIMKDNLVLYKSYLIKEQLSDILDETDIYQGIKRLDGWIKNVEETGIERLNKCARTIKRYYYGIVNYFRHGITNASSEGFNNKINVIKRRSYGFWDLDYFMLKIKWACGLMRENVS